MPLLLTGTGTEPCQKQCSCNSGSMAVPRARENTKEKAECKATAVQGISKQAQYKNHHVHQCCICPGSLNASAWPSPAVPTPPSFSPLPSPPSFSPLPSVLAQEDGHSLLPREGQCFVFPPHLRTCFLSPANCQNKCTEYAQIRGRRNRISCHTPENGNQEEDSENSLLLSAT